MNILYRRPSIDASYQVSVHLTKRFQRRRFFRNRPIRNKHCLLRPCQLTHRNEIINLYRGHSIDASYQILIHLAEQFQRRRLFRNQPIRNSYCLWWSYLLTDQEEINKLNRGLFIDASYPVAVHLTKRLLRKRFFRNRPIRNKNCLWQPCQLTHQNEMSNLYRGHSIDASYQVLIHLAEQFQRRRFFRNQPIRNRYCLWWQCLLTDWNKMCNLYREWRTFHRCFLSNFSSFG